MMADALPPWEPLAGEQPVLQVESSLAAADGVAMLRHSNGSCGGEGDEGYMALPCGLVVSQYRLCLRPAGMPEAVSVPLWMIETWRVARGDRHAVRALAKAGAETRAASVFPLEVQTKHLWNFTLLVRDARVLKTVKSQLTWCSRQQTLTQFPAFEFYAARPPEGREAPDMAAVEFGWNLYDPRVEFRRQMRGSEAQQQLFRLVELPPAPGSLYTVTPTYPRAFLEPAALSDRLLCRAMEARSRARVPAVSLVHSGTGAVLARSSQPLLRSPALQADWEVCYALAGRAGGETPPAPAPAPVVSPAPAPAPAPRTSPRTAGSFFDDSDEEPPHRAAASAAAAPASTTAPAPPPPPAKVHSQATLVVADCRPWSTAQGNAAMGGGYETSASYGFCRTSFFGIDNVFGVEKAFGKLREALRAYEGGGADGGFHRALADSQWLSIIQRVLVCGLAAARAVAGGQSCLVHCTDGWDRTSQCCAVAMLLTDAFYRTTVGFCILIEKEFCSFGHKMAERCGHQARGRTHYSTRSGVSASDTEAANSSKLEASPIFLQFMDIVFQLLRQFPEAFEFTPRLLELLCESAYSCLYGTFLCSCEQERRAEGVRRATASLWTDVLRRAQEERAGLRPPHLLSSSYDAEAAWAEIRQQPDALGRRTDAGGGGVCEMLLPSCTGKRLALWEDYYLQWDSDAAAEALRRRRGRGATQGGGAAAATLPRVPELEAHLQTFVDVACAARVAEREELEELEAAVRRMHSSAGDAAVSQWCAFDRGTCYSCYKSINSPLGALWSNKVMCTRECKQPFCPDCYDAHKCFE